MNHIFAHMPGDAPLPEAMHPIQNNPHWNKPNGGIWTSPSRTGNHCAWLEYSWREEQGTDCDIQLWELVPHESNLLVIDTLKNFEAALYRYRFHRDEIYESLGDTLDFVALSEKYDGVHLTHNGQWETHSSHPHNLYGWDCESTLWFKWCFAEVIDLGIVHCDRKEET